MWTLIWYFNLIDFQEKLPELEQAVKDASFFSIDAEFTGLWSENNITQFDTPAEYYKKTAEYTKGYIIIQFGITAFRASQDDPHTFKYRSYNFFVYPRGRRQKFLCQGESMRFLSSQNFDFNKLFRDGISCCPLVEANKLRESFDEKNAKRELYDKPEEQVDIEVPEEEKESLKHVWYNTAE